MIHKHFKTKAKFNEEYAASRIADSDICFIKDTGEIWTHGVFYAKVEASTTNGNIKINGTETTVYTHPSGTNPHGTTKSDVGLGSVVNTGDSATPVSGGTTKFTTGGAYTELAKKVDKVSGKGLSTNDYTDAEKNKVAGIAAGAEVNVQSDWNATEGDAFIKNKPSIPAAVAVKGNAESSYRTGNVNITPANIGLGNVGNFKAVSTAASQGLTATEQANARTNIAAVGETINTTWANLKSARDNSTLIPGQWYRITDYVTTTMQENTQSAGHQFDIIVRADDVNVLNENAFAAKHSGDTYFTNAGAKLEAWQLKYTLDNKYWSLVPHGEQIVYMGGILNYIGTIVVDDTTYYKWERNYCSLSTSVGDTLYYYDSKNERLFDSGYTIIDYIPSSDANGKGTIYWMKDEFDNECSYDFKNIQFKFTSAIENSGIVANVFYYTFSRASGENDATITDHSLVKYCIKNKVIFIGDDNDRVKLPFNVFRCNSASELFTKNTIIGDAQKNTFSSAQYNEIIGVGCRGNSFGSGCYSNKIYGIDCSNNTFYSECINNNLFGKCSSNIIGKRSYGNKFEYSGSITLGQKCEFNTFENGCRNISLGERCKNNTFGKICSNITFGTSESTKSYCQYIVVENGNKFIYLDCSATTSGAAYFQNVKIAQGVNNTDTYKTITHTTAGDTFQTIYKPANSVEVSV